VAKKISGSENLYASAQVLFERGEIAKAERQFRRYLYAAGLKDLIRNRHTNDCPVDVRYDAFESNFRQLLDLKDRGWQDQQLPQPSFLSRPEVLEPDLAINSQMKLLFIFPEFIHNSGRFVECDMKDHLFESAMNAGIRSDFFFSDQFAYPLLNLDPVASKNALQKLFEKIESSRPDVIVFDGNFIGDDVSLNASYLRKIKEIFKTKLVVFIGDGWGETWLPVADYWGSVVDLIMHIAPGGAVEQRSAFRDRLVCSPYPVNNRNFFPDATKAFDVSFFGSYVSYLRPLWLTSAIRAANKFGLETNIRAHERTNDCPNMADYAKILRRSRMVLNFSSRYGQVKMMTGRVWQAMHSGVVLLEEDNDMTEHFYLPLVHYAPFENILQLTHMMRFFDQNKDYAQRLGVRAAAFSQKYYSASSIWARILGRL